MRMSNIAIWILLVAIGAVVIMWQTFIPQSRLAWSQWTQDKSLSWFEAPMASYPESYRANEITATYTERNGASKTVTEQAASKLPLVINTLPKNARVRIMNIKPVYRPGMLLAPGRYDIEVSLPGYRIHRRLVTLSRRQTTFTIPLASRRP